MPLIDRPLFLYSFIILYYIIFYLFKKNCDKKQNSNSALQPLALSLLDTLIDWDSIIRNL